MKKITLILSLLFSCIVFSQAAGDILFVGFNADGDKDFAIVAMKDLPANTEIYFTDNEPNADGDGNMGGEGILRWDTGASIISAGTVVVFTDVDLNSNPSIGVSIGALTYIDAGFNIAASGDCVYATYGNPGSNSVITWIAGLQNNDDPTETNFSKTGLSMSSSYVVIDNTASKDGGYYSGVKTGETQFADYVSLILDEENWTTSTTDGESLLPFDTVAFSLAGLSFNELDSEKIRVFSISGKIVSDKGEVSKVFNVLGQEVFNLNLSSGLYLVLIHYNNKQEMFKIAL